MDFLGGALPNIMFIVGMLAIGLGLGIELKLVPLNKEIDKTGRIGAMIVGVVLVAGSVFMYLNPSLTNRNQASPTTANAALAPVGAAPTASAFGSSAAAAPTSLPIQAVVATEAPTIAPAAASTATPMPIATSIPTAVPATKVPSVRVPDLQGLSEKEALSMLSAAGLRGSKVDRCTGRDQGDSKAKKHEIQCQNPGANAAVPRGTTVEYVLR